MVLSVMVSRLLAVALLVDRHLRRATFPISNLQV
jgi:hypothetical protein